MTEHVTRMSTLRGVDALLDWAQDETAKGAVTGAVVLLVCADRKVHCEGAGSFQMGDAMWAWEVFKSRQLPPVGE